MRPSPRPSISRPWVTSPSLSSSTRQAYVRIRKLDQNGIMTATKSMLRTAGLRVEMK